MRTIDYKAARAFLAGKAGTLSNNTKVVKFDHVVELEIFGNTIARMDKNTGIVSITTCGYDTHTTKSRLWALGHSLGIDIRLYREQWVVNRHPWDGKWIDIYNTKTGGVLIDNFKRAA